MKLTILLLLALALSAGENINGIYLGTDVAGFRPIAVAIQITEDGTVTAFRGAIIPGMKDRHGKPVVVRQVRIVDVRQPGGGQQ